MQETSRGLNTQFLLLWIGQTVSIFGDRVTGFALPWLLYHETQSAPVSGIIIAIRYLPLILFGLIAGLIVDRLNRRLTG